MHSDCNAAILSIVSVGMVMDLVFRFLVTRTIYPEASSMVLISEVMISLVPACSFIVLSSTDSVLCFSGRIN